MTRERRNMPNTTTRRRDQSAYDAANKLRIAVYERKLHSDDCPRWDYEATNCDVCDAHDAKVRTLRASWKRACVRQGGAP